MLYRLARWIARLTLTSYFRKITIAGQENVSPKGPIIFVANHPSAFMDPMVVACTVSRPLNFLVAAEFFGRGFKSWFYQNLLNMIPVYRPNTLPGEGHKNEGVFTKVIELLTKGKSILVFPEGNSVTEKRIRKLKTGVARMALSTKEAPRLNVRIIPVGLNYANPHRFRSDLFVNIGKPISIERFSSSKDDVQKLTEEIERELKKTVLHIQREDLDSIVKKVDLVLKRNLDAREVQLPDKIFNQQKIIDSISNLSDRSPHLLKEIEVKLDEYLNKIRHLGVSDTSIAKVTVLISAGELIRLLIMLPIFLAGLLINYPPYYATVRYFRRLNRYSREGFEAPKGINQAFKGSVAMGIGSGMFIAYYLMLTTILSWYSGSVFIGFGSLPVFYFTGLITMQYIRWFYLFQQKWRMRNLVARQQDVFVSLIAERQEIIKSLIVLTN